MIQGIETRKLWDVRGRKIVGVEAQLGDLCGRGSNKQEAIQDLLNKLTICATYENCEPTVATYGPHTLIVYHVLDAWAYRFAGGRCIATGYKTRDEATGAGRDHVAQWLMDGKVFSRETVRDIAADKSLFDSLYPTSKLDGVDPWSIAVDDFRKDAQ